MPRGRQGKIWGSIPRSSFFAAFAFFAAKTSGSLCCFRAGGETGATCCVYCPGISGRWAATEEVRDDGKPQSLFLSCRFKPRFLPNFSCTDRRGFRHRREVDVERSHLALKCGSGLYSPLFPRFAIAGEESAYRVKGDVLHPSLVAVGREGESNSFEPFVRRYESPQGFGLEVLRSLDFHGNDGRPFLHKEIDFHGGIGRATLFPTSFRPNTTHFPTSFKQDSTLFWTSLGNVGGGVDCIAGLVEKSKMRIFTNLMKKQHYIASFWVMANWAN